jgi:hypothetical protein
VRVPRAGFGEDGAPVGPSHARLAYLTLYIVLKSCVPNESRNPARRVTIPVLPRSTYTTYLPPDVERWIKEQGTTRWLVSGSTT